jgi:hypothetical protein
MMNYYKTNMSTEHDPDDHDIDNEYEVLLNDLASDSEDFARSDEEGWYYSDEN